MIISVDIDGCLANFNLGYGDLFKGWGFPYNAKAFPPVWDWPEHYGATGDEVDKVWQEIKASPTFWELLPPLPKALEALGRLNDARDRGHEIYFLTSRVGVDCKGQTWRWLKRCGYVDPTILICTSGHGSKGAICEGLGVDAIIDDKPENLQGCPNATRAYLINYSHNQGANAPTRAFTRVPDVLSALDRETL